MDSRERNGDAHIPAHVVITHDDVHHSGVIDIIASLDGHIHHGLILAATTTWANRTVRSEQRRSGTQRARGPRKQAAKRSKYGWVLSAVPLVEAR